MLALCDQKYTKQSKAETERAGDLQFPQALNHQTRSFSYEEADAVELVIVKSVLVMFGIAIEAIDQVFEAVVMTFINKTF